MSQPVFITSAIAYVNNSIHLGNLIGSTLSADVYARYRRNKGHHVLYLCGVDCYGTTTEIKARQENLSCEEICEKYANIQKEIYDWFNIQFDVWGKTSTATQTTLVEDIFDRLYANNHVEKKTSRQLYCSTCKMFLADRYLKGSCYTPECMANKIITNGDQCDKCNILIDVEQLINPYCSICTTPSEFIDTQHFYLKLGDFQDQLIKHYLTDDKVKMNDGAKMITTSWLNKKLESRCITRDLKWGTPVKEIYIKNKVFYVWFDAPLAYFSILKHDETHGKDIDYWLSGEIVQTFGKDNVPFHTVLFPATLMGSDNIYPIPTQISSTEYLDYEGQKFSKSNNVGIFGDHAIKISEKLGINEDYWRFYLIKIRPETRDTSFTWDEFLQTIRGDLVNNIGNLINRAVTLSSKFCNGKTTYMYTDAMKETVINRDEFDTNMMAFKLKSAIQNIITIGNIGNKYLQDMKPWVLFKNADTLEQAQLIMGQVNMICYTLITLCKCIMPNTANRLLQTFISSNDDLFASSQMIISTDGYTIPFKPLTKKDIEGIEAINKN